MSQAEITLKLEQLAPSNEIGKAKFIEKKFDESKEAYLKTEEITQKILEGEGIDLNDIKDEYICEMIKCFNNLSLLFFKKRDFDTAQDYAQKAINLCENANIQSEEKKDKYPLSLDLYEKSQKRFTEANWKRYAPKLNYSQVSYRLQGEKKVFQKSLFTQEHLVLHQENEKGIGVLAGEDIEAGKPIEEFVGEILPTDDLTKMTPEQAADDYRFEAVMPNKFAFNHTAFINDGFPNMIIIRALGEGNEYRLAAVALDDISKGEALAFDYRTHRVKTNFYQISTSSYEKIKLFFNQRPLEAEYESLFEVSSQQIFGDESNPAFRAFKIKQCLAELIACLPSISKDAKIVIPFLDNKKIDLTKEKEKKLWSIFGYFLKMDFVMNTPIVFTKLLLDRVFSVSQLHQYFTARNGDFHYDVKKFFSNCPVESLGWGILGPIQTYPAEDKLALIYLRCNLIIPLLQKGDSKSLCSILWSAGILNFLVDQFDSYSQIKRIINKVFDRKFNFKDLERKNHFLSFDVFCEEFIGNIKSAEKSRDGSGDYSIELKPFQAYCIENSGASSAETFLDMIVTD
jgi:hypothetical protein